MRQNATSIKIKALVLSIGVILFISTLKFVNYNRAVLFNKDRGENITIPQNTGTRFIGIAVTRWVGIEGLAAVIGKKEELGSSLLSKALNEKPTHGTSFYDREIINSIYNDKRLSNNNFITIQGMISFLYYSGSKTFLFCFCFLIGLVCRVFELITLKASKGNLIFTSLIAYVLAFRVIHFGYIPSQSYMLLSAIIFNITLFYLIESEYPKNLVNFFKRSQKI
ncbi:hypothetical protein [Halobacteriovorax sp.]|uniref:hypothetical protein n=1 Tax=Halobacteriovorax sp. TaxID=2020862 RepID=UPI003AF21777